MSVSSILKTMGTAVVLLITIAFDAFAVLPPRIDFEYDLLHGNISFIGRAIKLTELERDFGSVKVEMEVEITECLYGDGCQKGRHMLIEYFSQFNGHTTFPVYFDIGNEYVFVLRQGFPEKAERYVFDSDVIDGVDEAFFVGSGDRFDQSFYFDEEVQDVLVTSVYGGKSVFISKEKLKAIVQKRRNSLIRSDKNTP